MTDAKMDDNHATLNERGDCSRDNGTNEDSTMKYNGCTEYTTECEDQNQDRTSELERDNFTSPSMADVESRNETVAVNEDKENAAFGVDGNKMTEIVESDVAGDKSEMDAAETVQRTQQEHDLASGNRQDIDNPEEGNRCQNAITENASATKSLNENDDTNTCEPQTSQTAVEEKEDNRLQLETREQEDATHTAEQMKDDSVCALMDQDNEDDNDDEEGSEDQVGNERSAMFDSKCGREIATRDRIEKQASADECIDYSAGESSVVEEGEERQNDREIVSVADESDAKSTSEMNTSDSVRRDEDVRSASDKYEQEDVAQSTERTEASATGHNGDAEQQHEGLRREQFCEDVSHCDTNVDELAVNAARLVEADSSTGDSMDKNTTEQEPCSKETCSDENDNMPPSSPVNSQTTTRAIEQDDTQAETGISADENDGISEADVSQVTEAAVIDKMPHDDKSTAEHDQSSNQVITAADSEQDNSSMIENRTSPTSQHTHVNSATDNEVKSDKPAKITDEMRNKEVTEAVKKTNTTAEPDSTTDALSTAVAEVTGGEDELLSTVTEQKDENTLITASSSSYSAGNQLLPFTKFVILLTYI